MGPSGTTKDPARGSPLQSLSIRGQNRDRPLGLGTLLLTCPAWSQQGASLFHSLKDTPFTIRGKIKNLKAEIQVFRAWFLYFHKAQPHGWLSFQNLLLLISFCSSISTESRERRKPPRVTVLWARSSRVEARAKPAHAAKVSLWVPLHLLSVPGSHTGLCEVLSLVPREEWTVLGTD